MGRVVKVAHCISCIRIFFKGAFMRYESIAFWSSCEFSPYESLSCWTETLHCTLGTTLQLNYLSWRHNQKGGFYDITERIWLCDITSAWFHTKKVWQLPRNCDGTSEDGVTSPLGVRHNSVSSCGTHWMCIVIWEFTTQVSVTADDHKTVSIY